MVSFDRSQNFFGDRWAEENFDDLIEALVGSMKLSGNIYLSLDELNSIKTTESGLFLYQDGSIALDDFLSDPPGLFDSLGLPQRPGGFPVYTSVTDLGMEAPYDTISNVAQEINMVTMRFNRTWLLDRETGIPFTPHGEWWIKPFMPDLTSSVAEGDVVIAISDNGPETRATGYGTGRPTSGLTSLTSNTLIRSDDRGQIKQFQAPEQDVDLANKDYVDRRGWSSVPSSATSPGLAGMKAYNSTYLFICVANNTWRRVAISAW